MDGDSGTSIKGIATFDVSEIGMRLNIFCTSSSETSLQFLGFTFRSGANTGADVFRQASHKKYNRKKEYKKCYHGPKKYK